MLRWIPLCLPSPAGQALIATYLHPLACHDAAVPPIPSPVGGLHHLIEHADEFGTILLSPTSRSSTWDMLRGGYGPGEGWEGNREGAYSQPGAAGIACSKLGALGCMPRLGQMDV